MRMRARILAMLVLVGAASNLAAQDTDDQQSALEDATALVARLAELDAAMARLQTIAEGQDEGIVAGVARREASYSTDRRSVVWDLADLVDGLPGDPTAQQIAALSDSLLIAELDRIEADAVAPYEDAARLRAQRAETAPADMVVHELRLATIYDRIADLIGGFVDTIERIQNRGLTPPAIVSQLDQFLVRRSELSLAEMDLATDERDALESAVVASGAPADADTQARIAAANARFEYAGEAMSANLELMDRRELETAFYREELVVRSGSFSRGNLDVQVIWQLAGRAAERVSDWLATNGGTLFVRILSFFGILFVFRALSGFVKRLARRGVSTSRLNLSRLLQDTFVTWTGRLVMFLGVLIALTQVGLDLGPVLAGLGVAGFIVGFALQDTLSNFAAGMMILIYRPFDVDDLVEAGGQFGKVAAMSLVSTTILSLDNQRLIVPNSAIWGGVIRNMTAEDIRRVDLVMGIGYADDIPKAEALLTEIVEKHPLILDNPEPVVKLQNLGDSSVDFVVRPWCKTDDYWDVHWDVTRAVKLTFDEQGVSIPFPQRDVHLFNEGAPLLESSGTVETTAVKLDESSSAGRPAEPDAAADE